jgi:hypothetical protein
MPRCHVEHAAIGGAGRVAIALRELPIADRDAERPP